MKGILFIFLTSFLIKCTFAQVSDGAKIKLQLSANRIFVGGTITISGESAQVKTLNNVRLKVYAPNNVVEKSLKLTDGKFVDACKFIVVGRHIIVAYSSDNKDSVKQFVEVVGLAQLGTIATKNIETTKKAEKQLEDVVDQTAKQLSNEDAVKLKDKLNETKKRITALQVFYSSVNDAGKKVAQSGVTLSKTEEDSFSELNNQMIKDDVGMNKFLANTHKPAENTICEILVMLNEAAAAFSTASNIASFPISAIGIVKNIAIDKAVPYGADAAGSMAKNSPSSAETSTSKAGIKFFAQAAADGSSLLKQIATFGFLGDMVSYITDFLIKKYCGIIKAKIMHKHKADFNNDAGQAWWKYTYNTESILYLRYPKANGDGNIVKMKGNIEGNATNFMFFSDASRNDDFRKAANGNKFGKNSVFIKPLCVPFATSEKDALGFGAVARAIATPAYFNIPVDAELNRSTNTLKLFMNPALIDFTPMVATRVVYFEFVPVPLVFIQEYPYTEVFLSMNAVIKRSSGIKVNYSSKGKLNFKYKDKFDIGAGSSVALGVELSIEGKQEN